MSILMRLSAILYIGACCLSQLVAMSTGAVASYDDIVALRLLQLPPPPPAAICGLLRRLDVCAVCQLVSCSHQPCLHFVLHRGRRASRCIQQSSSQSSAHPAAFSSSDPPCALTLSFGCLNTQSLLNRFDDDVIKLWRDHPIDVLCLVESWHDSDSAVIGRL